MDLNAAREVFEASQDLTVGIEEEWAIIDPQTLELVPKYEALRADADLDDVLAVAVSGELISSEIEIRSGRGEDVKHALALQHEARRRLFALAEKHGAGLASTGTHPLSDYREQHIIDTDHYHRVQDGLQYVAHRNNTFALQVHVVCRAATGRSARATACGPCCRCCWRSPPTRRSSTGATPGCTRPARRPSPSPSRAAVSRTPSAHGRRGRSTSSCCCGRTRSSSTPSSGGPCARITPTGRSRCASATRRRPPGRPTR